MIRFLFGKNNLQLQEKLRQAVAEGIYDEKINVFGENCNLNYLSEVVQTPNIFSQKIGVIVSLEKASDEDIIDYIKVSIKAAKTTDVLFYSPKTFAVNSKVLNILKNLEGAKITEVKEEKDWTVFNFADAVFGQNRERAYKLLQNLESGKEEPAKIHAILTNHLRNIARVSYGAEIKAAPFVKTKLQKQAAEYTKDAILKIYQYFYETDKDLKTGKIPENIVNIMEIEKIFENGKKDDAKKDLY